MGSEEFFWRFVTLYTILNAFCAYLIIAIAIRNFKGKGRALVYQTFTRLAIYLAMVITVDTIVVLGNDRMFRLSDFGLMLLLSMYYLFITLAGQCGFVYFRMILHRGEKWTTTMHLKSSIITMVNVGLLLVNVFTKQFFYVENHTFHFGNGIAVEFLLSYGYCAVTALNLAIEANLPENEYRSQMIHRLIIFSLIPAIAGAVQLLTTGYYPLLSIGYAISLTAMYIESLENGISRDAMTGVNNKGHLLQELNYRLLHRKENTITYLFMMDLNRFKVINDTYGHQEGDLALIHFAEALKHVTTMIPYQSFLARFGGDEFVLLVDVPEKGTIEMDQEIAERISTSMQAKHVETAQYSGFDIQRNLEQGIWQPGRKEIERRLKIFHWVNRIAGNVHATHLDEYTKGQRNLPEVKLVIDAVYRAVDEVNRKYATPYHIETSVGVGRLSSDVKTVQGLMSLADEDLYQQKKIAHGEACATNQRVK